MLLMEKQNHSNHLIVDFFFFFLIDLIVEFLS